MEEIKVLFKKAGLTKKEFAELVGLTHQTVNNWGSSKNVPHWVRSWLELYIKSRTLEDFKDLVLRSGLCEGNANKDNIEAV